jgi:hypothetical protein
MAKRFITVSIEIMHDSNLNQSQKFILAEIEQLSQLDKGCIATNNHFSELIGITKENVSKNINDLEKKGYIAIELAKGTRNHTRIITLTKIVTPPYQNSNPPLSKQQETKENRTSNKTNNTSSADYSIFQSAWNEYANRTGKSKIALLTQKRKDKILTRKKEIPNLEEIFTAILNNKANSSFLRNGNFFTFDWIFENDTNIIKVYEGRYDDKNEDWK